MALLKPVLFDPRKDMRAQTRARLEVHGTLFLPEEKYEQKCLVLDLSPDGAGLKSTCTAALGTRVVLHVQNLGRYEGTLIRHDRVYVGVQFKFTDVKRARRRRNCGLCGGQIVTPDIDAHQRAHRGNDDTQ